MNTPDEATMYPIIDETRSQRQISLTFLTALDIDASQLDFYPLLQFAQRIYQVWKNMNNEFRPINSDFITWEIVANVLRQIIDLRPESEDYIYDFINKNWDTFPENASLISLVSQNFTRIQQRVRAQEIERDVFITMEDDNYDERAPKSRKICIIL